MQTISPPAQRLYTCTIVNVLHSKTFPHIPGTSNYESSRVLNKQFQDWLEATAPGARAAGRVTGIRFSDVME